MHEKLVGNIGKVIIGKDDVVMKLMTALLAGGHVLIEDVPGVGKTTMAKALAKSIDLSFQRIQFTPDLLPSDILGVSIYNREADAFVYKKGPIFSQIILADEINRASPKTQSSLLEAMEERQVTMDGVTHTMEEPFMVLATQNPIEYEGTFPLPEAQLDRFIMKLSIGYPDKSQEMDILAKLQGRDHLSLISSVLAGADVLAMREEVDQIHVEPAIWEYIVDITRRTRESDEIVLGASPRASLALYKTARAHAYLAGRTYVLPEDVKALAPDVLSHRLIIKPEVRYKGRTPKTVIEDILQFVRVPKVMDK